MASNRHHSSISWLICCSLLLIMLAACSTNSPPPVAKGTFQIAPATSTSSSLLGAPNCQPPTPVHSSKIGLPEAEGTAPNVQVWALFFNPLPLRSGQENKIVWRITGSGNFQLAAVGPHSIRISPNWIEPHGSSSWQKPGEEWGSGVTFPSAGCWDLHVTRGSSTGNVWLVIQ